MNLYICHRRNGYGIAVVAAHSLEEADEVLNKAKENEKCHGIYTFRGDGEIIKNASYNGDEPIFIDEDGEDDDAF